MDKLIGNIEISADDLKSWRRSLKLSQSELAAKLGVSQQAVSYWERGFDAPSQKVISKLKGLMSRPDALAIERYSIRDQLTVRALVEYDGVKLIETSQGFKNLWGDFCQLQGEFLQDKLVNEMRSFYFNDEFRKEILEKELVIASGVSLQNVDVTLGGIFKHRWHVCFKTFGDKIIADMLFELCEEEAKTGIDKILRIDDIKI